MVCRHRFSSCQPPCCRHLRAAALCLLVGQGQSPGHPGRCAVRHRQLSWEARWLDWRGAQLSELGEFLPLSEFLPLKYWSCEYPPQAVGGCSALSPRSSPCPGPGWVFSSHAGRHPSCGHLSRDRPPEMGGTASFFVSLLHQAIFVAWTGGRGLSTQLMVLGRHNLLGPPLA